MAMFGTAAFFDLRNRSVSDLLWIVFGAAAGMIYLFNFPSFNDGILDLISIALAGAIAFGIYKSGLFGGADALALFTFSVILPVYGNTEGAVLTRVTAFHPIAPLIVLTNAAILSVSQVGFNLIRNLVYHRKHPHKLFEGFQHETAARKMLAVLVGHRSEKTPQYAFAIEKTTEGRKQFDFALEAAETAEYESRQDVWITPGIPFIVYLFAGFVAMILVGDLMAIAFGFASR